MSSNYDYAAWKSNPITVKYRALLSDAIAEYTKEISNLERDDQHKFVSSYYMLRGLIQGLQTALDADLLDEEEAMDGTNENLQ